MYYSIYYNAIIHVSLVEMKCLICNQNTNNVFCSPCIEKLRIHSELVGALLSVVDAKNINALTDLFFLIDKKSLHGNIMINFVKGELQSTCLKVSTLPYQSIKDILI
jgi:hypothetical protein